MMRWTAAAVAALLLILLAWGIVLYNRLVLRRNLAKEAWSGIDVQLKRRHDLLPKLVEVVRAYASHERQVLQETATARGAALAAAASAGRAQAENALTGELRSLLAVAEGYPDLKANASYLDLQRQISEIEEQIQYARRYYNGTVRDLNVLVDSFPANLVARRFGFSAMEYFEIELATRSEGPGLFR